mgnify:FL=1
MPPSIGRSPRNRDCGLLLLAMNVIQQCQNYCTNNLIDIYGDIETIGSEIFKGQKDAV